MLKITEDRQQLNKATKKLDRALEKITNNNQAMRVVDYGDTLLIELFGYSAALVRSKTDNSYTGKLCRCDELGQVHFTVISPVEVTWTARVVGSLSNPRPKSIRIELDSLVRYIGPGEDYSLGVNNINSSDNLVANTASMFLRGVSEVENGLWLFRNSDSMDLLVTLVHKRQPMSRVIEHLSNSFGLPKKVGRPLLLEFGSIDLSKN